MNDQEREALRGLHNRLGELLEEQEQKEVRLGSYGDLELWIRESGEELRLYSGEHVRAADYSLTLTGWLRQLLEAQRPRVYRQGDDVPVTVLWWNRLYWEKLQGRCLDPGDAWMPQPPAWSPP